MRTLIDSIAFPEGPAFDKQDGLWLVEKEAGNLIYWKTDSYSRIAVGGHPNGIAIHPDGSVWFCDSQQNSIRRYDPASQQVETIVAQIDGQVLHMPNDLCFDALGNLLFTCPGDSLDDFEGYICFYHPEKGVKKIAEQLNYPNGLAFSADSSALYIAETGSKWIWKYRWNAQTQEIDHAEQFFFTGGTIGPDGIAFDQDGNLYIAVYSAAKICIVNPEGVVIDELTLPGNNPTNCAIDPNGRLGIVITEAEEGKLWQVPSIKKGLL